MGAFEKLLEVFGKLLIGTLLLIVFSWKIGVTERFINTLVEMQLSDENGAKVWLVILHCLAYWIIRLLGLSVKSKM